MFTTHFASFATLKKLRKKLKKFTYFQFKNVLNNFEDSLESESPSIL